MTSQSGESVRGQHPSRDLPFLLVIPTYCLNFEGASLYMCTFSLEQVCTKMYIYFTNLTFSFLRIEALTSYFRISDLYQNKFIARRNVK